MLDQTGSQILGEIPPLDRLSTLPPVSAEFVDETYVDFGRASCILFPDLPIYAGGPIKTFVKKDDLRRTHYGKLVRQLQHPRPVR